MGERDRRAGKISTIVVRFRDGDDHHMMYRDRPTDALPVPRRAHAFGARWMPISQRTAFVALGALLAIVSFVLLLSDEQLDTNANASAEHHEGEPIVVRLAGGNRSVSRANVTVSEGRAAAVIERLESRARRHTAGHREGSSKPEVAPAAAPRPAPSPHAANTTAAVDDRVSSAEAEVTERSRTDPPPEYEAFLREDREWINKVSSAAEEPVDPGASEGSGGDALQASPEEPAAASPEEPAPASPEEPAPASPEEPAPA